MSKVAMFYSGGLDTSVCIPMMREEYGYDEVVTITVNVGLPEDEIAQAEEKAKKMGCIHYTIDARDEFAKDYIFQAIKANGDYQGYPLSTSIARPLIAKLAAEIIKKEGAEAVCHGCTGKGNDQFRLEFGLRCNVPKDVKIIKPYAYKNANDFAKIMRNIKNKIEENKSKGVIYNDVIEEIIACLILGDWPYIYGPSGAGKGENQY